jgi:hypothetical protein
VKTPDGVSIRLFDAKKLASAGRKAACFDFERTTEPMSIIDFETVTFLTWDVQFRSFVACK